MFGSETLLVLLLILLTFILLIDAIGVGIVCLIAGSMVFSEWYRQRCTTSEHGVDTGAYKVVPDAAGRPKFVPAGEDDDDESETETDALTEAQEKAVFWKNYFN